MQKDDIGLLLHDCSCRLLHWLITMQMQDLIGATMKFKQQYMINQNHPENDCTWHMKHISHGYHSSQLHTNRQKCTSLLILPILPNEITIDETNSSPGWSTLRIDQTDCNLDWHNSWLYLTPYIVGTKQQWSHLFLHGKKAAANEEESTDSNR